MVMPPQGKSFFSFHQVRVQSGLCSGHRRAEGWPPAAPGTLLEPQEPPCQDSDTATMTGPPWPPTWAAWALLIKSEYQILDFSKLPTNFNKPCPPKDSLSTIQCLINALPHEKKADKINKVPAKLLCTVSHAYLETLSSLPLTSWIYSWRIKTGIYFAAKSKVIKKFAHVPRHMRYRVN